MHIKEEEKLKGILNLPFKHRAWGKDSFILEMSFDEFGSYISLRQASTSFRQM